MKRFFMAVVCVAMTITLSAQQKTKKEPKLDYVKATELTLLGKLCETTNPYHRVEVEKIEGNTRSEAN